MKNYYRKILVALSALLIIATLLTSCGKETAPETSVPENKDVALGEIAYVTPDQKESWRKPLEKLLANVGDRFDVSENPVYKDVPSIPMGYDCALLDVNFDGTPEVIINFGGGTAGNATYSIYDLHTGREIGDFDGAIEDAWCVYYDTATKTLCHMGEYRLREGWDMSHHLLASLEYHLDDNQYRGHGKLLKTDVVDHSGAVVRCSYEIDGKFATAEEYEAAYDEFHQNYLMREGTEMVVISWWDVTDDEDDAKTRGKKMAEALLSSDQVFVYINEQSKP